MYSQITEALGLQLSPVAIQLTNAKPEHATPVQGRPTGLCCRHVGRSRQGPDRCFGSPDLWLSGRRNRTGFRQLLCWLPDRPSPFNGAAKLSCRTAVHLTWVKENASSRVPKQHLAGRMIFHTVKCRPSLSSASPLIRLRRERRFRLVHDVCKPGSTFRTGHVGRISARENQRHHLTHGGAACQSILFAYAEA